MISVQKDFTNPPKGLVSETAKGNIKKAIIEKSEHKFSKDIYRDKSKDALQILYNSKCAYCEVKPENGNTKVQIDHYRPKKKLENEHEGYYWLGYEWSNLLPSCSSCNRNKHNYFPLENNLLRVILPENYSDEHFFADGKILKSEKPLLLNPEIDKIEEFFIFNPKGEIIAIDQNPRAVKTIEIIGLNSNNLIRLRKKIVEDLQREFREDIKEYIEQKITEDRLKGHLTKLFKRLADYKSSRSFSRLRYFMFHKFELFFVDSMPTKQSRDILLNHFKNFIRQ